MNTRDIELLDKIIFSLDRLIPEFSTVPRELAKKLRRKLRSMRDKANAPVSKDPRYNFSEEFLKEFLWLAAEFIDRNGLGDEYAKRRLGTLVSYANSLLEDYQRFKAS